MRMRSVPTERVKRGVHARTCNAILALLAVPLAARFDLPLAVTSMPVEIRDTYMRLDDLLRSDGGGTVRGAAYSSVPATTPWLAGALYSLNDHNPQVFAQYADETARKHGEYGSALRVLAQRTYATIRDGSAADGHALYSMLYADYILRVRVRAIEPLPHQVPDNVRYTVTADVLDTLKGRILPAMHGPAAAQGRSFLRFAYLPGNYIDPEEISRDRDEVAFPYRKTDPEFSTTSGGFTMTPGQDAIVFLRFQEGSSNAEPLLYLEPWASYNALPVINDQVRDVNTIWSDREIVRYAEWKERFMALKGRVVSR